MNLGNNTLFDSFIPEKLNGNENLTLKNNVIDDEEHDFSTNCIYYSELSFINSFSNSNEPILYSLNVRSLMKNHSSICTFLQNIGTTPIHFICLQEIWAILDDGPIQIPGYKFVFKQRSGGQRGGGVGIYIKDSYNFRIINELSVFEQNVFEAIGIEFSEQNSDNKSIIVNFYRPNNHYNLSQRDQIEAFFDIFEKYLLELDKFSCDIFITCDSNLNLLDKNSNTQRFSDLVETNGFYNVILKASRIFGQSFSLIDQIFVKMSKVCNFDSGVLIDTPSDHFAVFTKLYGSKCKTEPDKRQFRPFNKKNLDVFKSMLKALSWEEVLNSNDANNAYNIFHDCFFTLFELNFPILNKKCTKNRNTVPIFPFMTRGLLISRKTKQRLGREHKIKGTSESGKSYRKYRNIYNRLVSLSKKLYYESELEKFSRNPRKQPELIKDAIGLATKKNNSDIGILNVNGQTICDNKLKANYFNEYFSQIGTTTSNSVPLTDISFRSYFPPPPENTFVLFPVSTFKIVDVFNSIESKKSTDINDLSVWTLKHVIQEISVPLSHIINISFETGIFPEKLKTSKTVPVFKSSGSSESMNNYRPISMVNTFSKIMEKIVYNSLVSFLEKTGFFNECQFGFRENHNTFQAILKIINFITKGLNENNYVAGIFIDVSKAFDSVPIDILIAKLENCGVRGIPLTWFKSFLTERKQRVKVNGQWSDCVLEILIGVLQGSILGVLCFLIFINDFPTHKVSNFYKILFADDATALAKHRSYEELALFCNTELKKLNNWFKANRLLLNISKTKFMIFSPFKNINPKINLILDDINLCQVPNTNEISIRCLGVFIDKDLNLSDHIDKTCAKLAKSIFFLNRAKNILSTKALKTLFFTRVQSHLLYCLPLLSLANKDNFGRLLTLQKRAVRIVFNTRYNEHCDPLFHNLGVLPINLQRDYNILLLMHSVFYFRKPSFLCNTWETVSSKNDRYPLRNDDDYYLPQITKQSYDKHPYFYFATLWNKLDRHLKLISDRQIFIESLRDKFFSKFTSGECAKHLCYSCRVNKETNL